MMSMCEVICESLLQCILQWYIIYIAYRGTRNLSIFQYVTFCTSYVTVFIHITRPLLPKKLRYSPEEHIWFAIKRIFWPIVLNVGISMVFLNDKAVTFSMFYGTNIFVVLMLTQISYLCICMLLVIRKNCFRPSRQTQLKFLMFSGLSLIWCTKHCYFVSVYIKKPVTPGQRYPYENAFFSGFLALDLLVVFFLLVKSSITLEDFSEFWDIDKIFKSNASSSMLIMLTLATTAITSSYST